MSDSNLSALYCFAAVHSLSARNLYVRKQQKQSKTGLGRRLPSTICCVYDAVTDELLLSSEVACKTLNPTWRLSSRRAIQTCAVSRITLRVYIEHDDDDAAAGAAAAAAAAAVVAEEKGEEGRGGGGGGGGIYRRRGHHHHHHNQHTAAAVVPRRWLRAAAPAGCGTRNGKYTLTRQEVFETSVDLASLVCVGQGAHDLAALGPLPLNFIVFNMKFSRRIYVDPMQLARLSAHTRLPSQPQRHIVAAMNTAHVLYMRAKTKRHSSTSPWRTRDAEVDGDEKDTLNFGNDDRPDCTGSGSGSRSSDDDDDDDDDDVDVATVADIERGITVRNRVCQIVRYVGNDTLVNILICMRQLKKTQAKCERLEKSLEGVLLSQAEILNLTHEQRDRRRATQAASERADAIQNRIKRQRECIIAVEGAVVDRVQMMSDRTDVIRADMASLITSTACLNLKCVRVRELFGLVHQRQSQLVRFLDEIYPIQVEYTDAGRTFTVRGLSLPLRDTLITAPDDEQVATAFGYLNHLIFLLSKYLDVPLRYLPLVHGSRSVICDPVLGCELGECGPESPPGQSLFTLDWLHRPLPYAFLYGAERKVTLHTPGSVSLANMLWVLPLYWRGLDRTSRTKVPLAISKVRQSLVQVISYWDRHCVQAARISCTTVPETESLSAAAAAAGVNLVAAGGIGTRATPRRVRTAPIESFSRLSSMLLSRMPTGRLVLTSKGAASTKRRVGNKSSAASMW